MSIPGTVDKSVFMIGRRFRFTEIVLSGLLFPLVAFLYIPGHAELSWDLKWCTLMFASLSLLLTHLMPQEHTIYLPSCDRISLVLGGLAVLGAVLSFALNWPQVSIIRIGERISFFILLVYFFQTMAQTSKQTDALNRFAMLSIFSGFILVAGFHGEEWLLANSRTLSFPFFVNRNMFTEGLLLVSILLVCASGARPSDSALIGVAGFSCLVTYLISLQLDSRSALIIATFLLGTFILAILWKNQSRGRRALIGMMVFAVLLLPVSHIKYANSSTVVRKNLIVDSTKMIRSNFWGIGIGNYAWSERGIRNPTIESTHKLFKSPHNEVLRLASEEGLVTALGSYLFLAYWIVRCRRRIWNPLKAAGAVGALAFFTIETLFQFPFENPFSSLALAYLFAFHCEPGLFHVVNISGWKVRLSILILIIVLNLALYLKLSTLGFHA